MQNFKTFENWLLEADDEKKKTDPHEILTACVCLLGKNKVNSLTNLSQDNMDKILIQLSKIANTNKIIGKNDKEVESILKSSVKYEALCQAISAAKAILNNWKWPLNYVLLTGRSWHSDVKRFSGIQELKAFGIDSYGMKDFNSSDIILCDKSNITAEKEASKPRPSNFHCLGVSLKKKGNQKSAADPTMLNRSVFDALVGSDSESRTPEQTKIAEKIDKAFNIFYSTVLAKNAEALVTDNVVNFLLHPINKDGKPTKVNKKYQSFLQNKNPTAALKKWLKAELKSLNNKNQDKWKDILGSTCLMCTHESRENVRNIINKALGSKDSAFNTLLEIIQESSTTLANALMAIIYKGDLKALIEFNFDFGLCIGKGGVKKTKSGLVGEVGSAEYETIEAISKAISTFQSNASAPRIERSKKQKDFNALSEDEHVAAKLFLDLVVTVTDEDTGSKSDHTIANLEVRYKGSYTSSPQVFAIMSQEFKNYVDTGKW